MMLTCPTYGGQEPNAETKGEKNKMKIAKKLVTMCLVLAMIVTTFAVNTVDVKAEEANEPRITVEMNNAYSNSEGRISVTGVTKKAGNYEVIFCYNGTEGPHSTCSWTVGNDSEEAQSFSASVLAGNYFAELSNGGSAEITAKVYVGDEVVATSNAITVTLANERLENVTGVVVSGNTVTWNAVDGAVKYKVSLLNGNTYLSAEEVTGCSYDFSSSASIPDRISVVACSGDYSQKLDSNYVYVGVGGSTTPSDPTDPTSPAPPTDDSNSSNESDSSSESKEEQEVQTPENNYILFQESVKSQVDIAIAEAEKAVETGKTSTNTKIAIDTGVWISFKGDVYQKLQDSGMPVEITFMYKGERYRVNIPAGADLMSLVDENGYCGFLNLMAHFGGTKL